MGRHLTPTPLPVNGKRRRHWTTAATPQASATAPYKKLKVEQIELLQPSKLINYVILTMST
ncbi:hypothetical protein [Hydrogenophaga sp. BPS33]|uniref:hypothetical protein n=1 Tax=Hydrogenophaga sp. BPS33 TaxID=2651974 RepID=UPI001358D7B6|nr:hypothetical protein [Hydrogenophaga sp. BPS33]